MGELIQQYSRQVTADDGAIYLVRVYGEKIGVHTWSGWLEFHPLEDDREPLRTAEETSQPDRDALASWASGLEEMNFSGAFSRATSRKAAATPEFPISLPQHL